MMQTLAPAPELRFRHRVRIGQALRELWSARELVRTLAERDLRARYKQAILGFAWAIIVPVILMLVFTIFVRRVARIDTDPIPYPLFTYVGLLPWTFFSSSISGGGQSLVSNSALLNKVYCPREVFGLAGILVAAVDTLVSTTILGLLFIWFGELPKLTSFYLPLLMLIQLAFTIGATLLISALLVYLRDLRHLLPILLQFGLFATPVAYPVELRGGYEFLYAAINPLAPLIEGYRRVVLIGSPPEWPLVSVAALSAAIVLAAGYYLFKRMEVGFADVA